MAIDILVWKNKPVVETFTERKTLHLHIPTKSVQLEA